MSVNGNFMTSQKFIAAIAVVALFSCCSNNHDNKRPNEIIRIIFATGGCFGACPVQVIEIDSSLTTKYHGVIYSDSTGFYRGKVSNQFWDTLNMKFDSINYKNLDTSYEQSVDDLSTEILIFYGDNKIKHIFGQSSSLPDSVLIVYKWLLTSINQMKFEKTNDNLIFPTIIEKPLHVPPPPLYDNRQFVKPKKANR
jgi:hypothetical protein